MIPIQFLAEMVTTSSAQTWVPGYSDAELRRLYILERENSNEAALYHSRLAPLVSCELRPVF